MSGYDIESWVENDIAERKHRWVRYVALVPFAAVPLLLYLQTQSSSSGSPTGEFVTALLALAAIIAMISTLFSPFGARLWRLSWKAQRPKLDERERAIVAHAHATSYSIVLAALLLVFLYGWAAMSWGWWLPHTPEDLELLFFAVTATVPTLPIAIAEWTSSPFPQDIENGFD